ncbi:MULTISPECIES: hypothetical protein [unclassified Duganella]|nr:MULTISPECIES: hypothetical protein [unclassified Duganella]
MIAITAIKITFLMSGNFTLRVHQGDLAQAFHLQINDLQMHGPVLAFDYY